MKKIVIFGILVIMLVNLVPVSTGNTYSAGTVDMSDYNLNFNSYSIGSYPTNLSWINFHNVSQQQSTKISVENSSFGKGLLISTTAFRNGSDSFLDMGMNLFQNFTVKITFSWSENNSLSQTGNNIFLENDANKVLQYQFGSYYKFNLLLSTNKTYQLGKEPSPSELYTLQISGTHQGRNLFAGIVPGFNNTTHTPILFMNRSQALNNNYSFLFGGGFSRLTIYNIYIENDISGFSTFESGHLKTFNETNISSVYFSGINASLFSEPLVDWKDNSIIYASEQTGPYLYSYNFYNNTQKDLLGLNSSEQFISTESTFYDGYFLIGTPSGSIIEVYNYTTGVFNHYNMDFNPGTYAKLYILKDTVFVQSENGSLWIYNTTSGNTVSSISFPSDVFPVHSYLGNNSFITEFYNNTTENLSVIKIYQNGNETVLATYYLGEVDFNPSFERNASPSLMSVASYNYGVTPLFYLLMGDENLPFVSTSNFSVADNLGSSLYVRNNTGIYFIDHNCIAYTNVNANSQFVAFDRNGSRGLSIDNRTITLYSNTGNPFSPDNITIKSSVPGIIRGDTSINYTVNSNLNYTVSAKLGNVELYPENGTVNISSSSFENGTLEFSITATNIAGYTSMVRKSVTIDNYEPTVKFNSQNGSLLFEGSKIEFTISNIPGSVHTHVKEGSDMLFNFTGYEFNLTVPENTGSLSVSLEIMDQFGLLHNFTYFFNVENFNNSGYRTDILPGTYLPHGKINLTWTGTSIASSYNVTLISMNKRIDFETNENYTHLNLLSGNYFLEINATTTSDATLTMLEESFTVQSYNPNLTVNRTPGRYFSFYGNSPNGTLVIKAKTNVSSRIWLNYSYRNKSVAFYRENGTYLNYIIDRSSGLFKENGLYNISINAQENSGRSTSIHFIISVNNSIPTLIPENDTLYFNTSTERLPFLFQDNTTYWYNTNGNTHNITTLNEPYIITNSFSTDILLHALNRWHDYNQTSIHLIYSKEKPEISLKASPTELIWSRNLTVSYNITDPVELSSVVLLINNQTGILSNDTTGIFHYEVSGDGNFSLSMTVTDRSGNVNSTGYVIVKSFYFPEIKSIHPEVKNFLGITYLRAGIKGKDLQSVNVTWSMGGTRIGSGNSLWTFLMPGNHVLVLTVHYHSKNIRVQRRVFSLGFVPEVIGIFSITSFLFYRKYWGKADTVMSKELISNNLGKTRKEIYRIGRKSGLRKSTVSDTINSMQKSREIVLLKDPDGVIYLMDPGSASE